MKYYYKIIVATLFALSITLFTSCSSDNKPDEPTSKFYTEVINFDDAPADVVASDAYGANLYSAYEGGKQVTAGYIREIGNTGTFIQCPINFRPGLDPSMPWSYEFWNGGIALSKYHDTEGADYKNQCSVYGSGAHSGQIFAVATGYTGEAGAYDSCAKIYFTDAKGYQPAGKDQPVTGTAKHGKFNSVWISNTTYTYLTMKNGNAYTAGSLEDQKGWFKVVFIALNAAGEPTGKKVEYYLANYDAAKNAESGLTNQIRTGWNQINLSDLGESVCSVAINFEGSDTGDYGLNTPAYVALDDLDVTIPLE